MERSKKMVLLCHCILNANSKVEGLSRFQGAIGEVVTLLIEKGIGMIQLPCPELLNHGIKRWGQVKSQFDTPYYRESCQQLFKPYLHQLKDYMKNGYEIVGLVGINGSPTCGINRTCDGVWGGEWKTSDVWKEKIDTIEVKYEKGVFIEEIQELLKLNNIELPLYGLDESCLEESIKGLRLFIEMEESSLSNNK
ncbi:CD3072 family TudS-related putative desulfidase [Clostridium formicaceticum]|uniref:Uncharacterized protein n=1 Tax=Clostridium formicaceticum TaxID=1497 RepID=A0AAC9RML0_9CLOT|nr:CD3072 family TudS-related putative desulfidase [Clostridium formicaceticum]AOY77520.1 hypothetical protein BJL90_17660 [Clostridium formicaceticum]ARE88090.1 hypothetical protein CLFO_24910 [Clostridium formicaceticum]